MSKRLDKTNSENVQTFAQIGMIKRKCPNVWTNWNDKNENVSSRIHFAVMLRWKVLEGLRGFITFRIRKIKNIIYKGLFKNAPNPPLPSVHKQ